MPRRKRKYYCQRCDSELIGTSKSYLSCINGCGGLISWRQRHKYTTTKTEREASAVRKEHLEKYWTARKEELKTLPFCGIKKNVYVQESRSKHSNKSVSLWWIEGLEGTYRLLGTRAAIKFGDVKAHIPDGSNRVVMLRPLSSQAVINLLFGVERKETKGVV